MALDSQIPLSNKMILAHNATTSKFYQRIVIILFIALQMIAAYMLNNFYSSYKDLEGEVDKLHYQVEDLRMEMKLLVEPLINENRLVL